MAPTSNKFGYFCHKCRKENEDRMIHCFACDANFHAKCIGLNGSMADKINCDSGFHYYCEKHKNLSVKTLLYKLSCFQKLNNKLKMLLEEFSNLENYRPDVLLEELEAQQFINEDMLIDSTNGKKDTRRERKRKAHIDSQIASKIRKDKNPFDSTAQVSSHIQASRTSVSGNLQSDDVTAQTSSHIEPSSASVSGALPSVDDVIDCDETFTSSVVTNVGVPKQSSSLTTLPTLSSQNGRLRIATKPPKNKSIYVSRLDVQTDENEVKTYLSDVGGPEILNELKIFKLNSRSSYFSSFKIICPEALFDKIVHFFNEDGAVAREFIYNTTNLRNPLVSSKN